MHRFLLLRIFERVFTTRDNAEAKRDSFFIDAQKNFHPLLRQLQEIFFIL